MLGLEATVEHARTRDQLPGVPGVGPLKGVIRSKTQISSRQQNQVRVEEHAFVSDATPMLSKTCCRGGCSKDCCQVSISQHEEEKRSSGHSKEQPGLLTA